MRLRTEGGLRGKRWLRWATPRPEKPLNIFRPLIVAPAGMRAL
ncbi:MAG: hypothetical protein QOF65_2150, partial [Thermoleophilaceae bacterium]|nr:hypothetical protein [Thermoleophilaceae bacterium]